MFISQLRLELPLLETALRVSRSFQRIPPNSTADSARAMHKKRSDREVNRLLALVSVVKDIVLTPPTTTTTTTTTTNDGQTSSPQQQQQPLDCLRVIHPFVETVRSGPIGTDVKSVAVESLYRLVCHLDHSMEHCRETITEIAESIIECRFEQTDTSADEIAILWLLEALGATVRSHAGRLLSDDTITRVAETMFDACVAPFNSETIRCVATRLSCELMRECVFSTPLILSFDRDFHMYSSVLDMLELKMQRHQNHGFLCARQIFVFLVEQADMERLHVLPVTSRCVAIRLLTEAFSAMSIVPTSSPPLYIRDDTMRQCVRDDLCRVITQTCQNAGRGVHSVAQTTIVTETLRLAQLLFGNAQARPFLKFQFECFFNAVYARVARAARGGGPSTTSNTTTMTNTSTTNNTTNSTSSTTTTTTSTSTTPTTPREDALIVIESLCDLLALNVGLLHEWFVEYDCDARCTDIFEDTIKLLSRLAFPRKLSSPALDELQLAALRGLLCGVRSVADRVVSGGNDDSTFRAYKRRKHALEKCALSFNAKPKRGLEPLIELGLVRTDASDPVVIASFLRATPVLDKTAVGVFLGEDGPLTEAVRKAYAETFEAFRGRSIVEALRVYLEAFRLPKEAQQIDRVLQAFAEVAHTRCADMELFATVDACYVFTFGVILLNTDLHNPNIKKEKKMTVEQFLISNRNYGPAMSQGRSLPDAWLTAVYNDIKDHEINTMNDAVELTGHRWLDLVARASPVPQSHIPPIPSGGGDKFMFELIHGPALAAVSVAFDSVDPAEQPDALHAALDGFILLARAANRFGMMDVLDSVVASLCKFTSLLLYGGDVSSNNQYDGDSLIQHVTMFGNNYKGQIAARTVFAIARRFGSSIKRSWRHICFCVLRLNDLRLLPRELLEETTHHKTCLDHESRTLFHRSFVHAVTAMLENGGEDNSDGGDDGDDDTSSVGSGNAVKKTTSSSSWATWIFGGGGNQDDDGNGGGELGSEADRLRSVELSLRFVPDAAVGIFSRRALSLISSQDPASRYATECVKSCRVETTMINESMQLSGESLQCLVDALLHTVEGTVVVGDKDELGVFAPPSKSSKQFAIRLLTEIALANLSPTGSRLALIWPQVSECFLKVVMLESARTGPTYRGELAAIGLLRVCGGWFNVAHHQQTPLLPEVARMAEGFVLMLQKLVEMAHQYPAHAPGLARIVGVMIANLIRESMFDDSDGLPMCGYTELFALLETCCVASSITAGLVFDAFAELVARGKSIPTMNAAMVSVGFACASWQPDERSSREAKAVDILYELHEDLATRATKISGSRSQVDISDEWVTNVWIPLLRELAILAQTRSLLVTSRKRALQLLLLAVLDPTPGQYVTGERWHDLMEGVVFPAAQFILSHTPHDAGEALVAAATAILMCKIVTEYAESLYGLEERFDSLWIEILLFLERFKQLGLQAQTRGEPDGAVLSETITELIKNVLLGLESKHILLGAAHLLAAGEEHEGEMYDEAEARSKALWDLTWAVLDKSCPGLLALLPHRVAKKKSMVATTNDEGGIVAQETDENKQ